MRLAAANRREIRRRPIKTRPSINWRLCRHLAVTPTRIALDHQATLDGGIGKRFGSAAFTIGRYKPIHLLIDSQQQRASSLERLVVVAPISGSVF
jgi:hypothetical protein